MATRARALALALALVVVLAACSDESEHERAVAALKADMVANAGMTTGRAVRDDQTTCVAEGAVDSLGVTKLQDYGLLTEDLRAAESIQGVQLSPEDADVMAEVFVTCLGAEVMMERQIIEGLDLTRRQERRAARCVRTTVTADHVARTMSLQFQGAENPVFDELRDDLRSCLR
jgi:hypothetical protein